MIQALNSKFVSGPAEKIDFPGGASSKEFACQCRRHKRWMRIWFLSQEDPPEDGMATHSSNLAWEIPWTEEPGRLQSVGLQRVVHDWESTQYTNQVYVEYGITKSQTQLSDLTCTQAQEILITYSIPSIVLNLWSSLSPSIFTINLWGRYYHLFYTSARDSLVLLQLSSKYDFVS